MQKLNIKKVGLLFGTLFIVSLVAGFLTSTNQGRALVFAISDPQTTLQAAEIKAGYVNEFRLGLE